MKTTLARVAPLMLLLLLLCPGPAQGQPKPRAERPTHTLGEKCIRSDGLYEPIRQGVRQAFGGFATDLARGLAIRRAWGPQYTADAWVTEARWLANTISPSYVGEPTCNGLIERLGHRTPAQQQADALGRAA